MELSFIMAGEIMKYRITGKVIEMATKSTGYTYMEWDPLGRTAGDLARLRGKFGDEWLKEYRESMDKFSKMGSEDEIAKDLTKDLQKAGWRLVRKTK